MLRRFFNRFHSGIWTVTAINLIGAAGFSIAIPFIALYLHLDRGVSMTLVGLILLIGGLCARIQNAKTPSERPCAEHSLLLFGAC